MEKKILILGKWEFDNLRIALSALNLKVTDEFADNIDVDAVIFNADYNLLLKDVEKTIKQIPIRIAVITHERGGYRDLSDFKFGFEIQKDFYYCPAECSPERDIERSAPQIANEILELLNCHVK